MVREGAGFRVLGDRPRRWVAMTDLDNPQAVAYLQRRHYGPNNRAMRSCHPRDLIGNHFRMSVTRRISLAGAGSGGASLISGAASVISVMRVVQRARPRQSRRHTASG